MFNWPGRKPENEGADEKNHRNEVNGPLPRTLILHRIFLPGSVGSWVIQRQVTEGGVLQRRGLHQGWQQVDRQLLGITGNAR